MAKRNSKVAKVCAIRALMTTDPGVYGQEDSLTGNLTLENENGGEVGWDLAGRNGERATTTQHAVQHCQCEQRCKRVHLVCISL